MCPFEAWYLAMKILVYTLFALALLAWATLVGGIIYVAIHFITKFW
jgi:hypothetical protein